MFENCSTVYPSYTKLFRTHTLYQGGGHLDAPTISSTLGCRNLKFCKVLEIPFKVSENTRFVKNLLYGYHGNCLITWCFSLIIVKTSMKNRSFSNAPRNHKLEGVKNKTLCHDNSVLVRFKKVILKWVGVPSFGRDRWKNRDKCGKMIIFSGLNPI